MKTQRSILAALSIVASSAGLSSHAASLSLKLLGEPVSSEYADKTVTINEKTRFVQVESGQTVKFIVGDKAFLWHFDGPQGPFNLMQIAPPGTLERRIGGYVNPNPVYLP